MKTILDNRYSVSFEYCGYTKPRHITRFCDGYLGNYEIRKEALAALEAFEIKRRARL